MAWKQTEASKLVKGIYSYLQRKVEDAYREKNEVEFDCYSDAMEVVWCAWDEKPIRITPRVKPLW